MLSCAQCLITAGVAIGGSDSFENFLALVGMEMGGVLPG